MPVRMHADAHGNTGMAHSHAIEIHATERQVMLDSGGTLMLGDFGRALINQYYFWCQHYFGANTIYGSGGFDRNTAFDANIFCL